MNKVVEKMYKYLQYRDEYQYVLSEFKHSIIRYFIDKYGIKVRFMDFIDHFGIEKDPSIMYHGWLDPDVKESKFAEPTRDFNFTIDILYDFCKEFDCEFIETCCSGSRYIFGFKNMKEPFKWD